MKKSLLTSMTVALIFFSASSLAFEDLSANDANRLKAEVADMTKVLNLDEQQSKEILQLKANLTHATKDLLKKHGSRNADFRADRDPHWKTYRKALLSVITEKQFKIYNQSKSV